MKYIEQFESINFEDWEEEEINEDDSPLTNEEFVKFLNDNEIYDQFIKNYTNVIPIRNFCNKKDKLDYILSAFSWSGTKEGHFFWNKINQKWLNHYLHLDENINFNDWDDEEIEDIKFKKGDYVKSIGIPYFWNKKLSKFIKSDGYGYRKGKIIDVGHSNNIDSRINYKGLMIKLFGYWPWYKAKDFIKIKNNESIDFNDWEEEEINEEDSPLTDKEFVKFLKDNNVYDQFIDNCNDDNNSFKEECWKSLETFCTDIKKKNYFYDSFDWENSTEGYIFWRNINNKWLNHLDNMNESIDFNDWDEEEYEVSPLTNKKFVKFLKDNGVYNEFIYNCNNKANNAFIRKEWKSLKTFCTDLNDYAYIRYAFIWIETKEGYDFWNKIDDDWNKLLNESILNR